jgi:hypothetical protein
MVEKDETVRNCAAAEAAVILSMLDAGQFCKRYVDSIVTTTSNRQKLNSAAFKLQFQLFSLTAEVGPAPALVPWGCCEGAAGGVICA